MNKNKTDIQLVNQLCNTKIVDIMPILDKGEVNRVYVVKIENEKLIVRLNEESEISRFEKEHWCMVKASQCNIPSPQVIDFGISNNTAFMILEFVEGLNGEEIRQRNHIWNKLGSYAKKSHSIPTVGFGETMTQPGTFTDSWERYVSYNIESLNEEDALLRMNVINHSDSGKLRDLFKQLLKKQFAFGLSHNDISFANILVEDEQITLLDWGSAESTIVPHFEILGILEDSLQQEEPLFKDFLEGYSMSLEEYKNILPDMNALALLKAVDKLRWAINRSPERIEDFFRQS